MVIQTYETDVIKEFAIRGNAAIIKCQVPSYVADFINVVSWHTDKGDEFQAGKDYGKWNLVWPRRDTAAFNECMYVSAAGNERALEISHLLFQNVSSSSPVPLGTCLTWKVSGDFEFEYVHLMKV